MKIYACPLNRDVFVCEVEPGDEGQTVNALDRCGLGYAVFGDHVDIEMMVIDGRVRDGSECRENLIWATIAHELGHITLKTQNDVEADLWGKSLLERKGMLAAARLLDREAFE